MTVGIVIFVGVGMTYQPCHWIYNCLTQKHWHRESSIDFMSNFPQILSLVAIKHGRKEGL